MSSVIIEGGVVSIDVQVHSKRSKRASRYDAISFSQTDNIVAGNPVYEETYGERTVDACEGPSKDADKTIRQKRAKEAGHLTLTRLTASELQRGREMARRTPTCFTAGPKQLTSPGRHRDIVLKALSHYRRT
jgi:hypothetical protein